MSTIARLTLTLSVCRECGKYQRIHCHRCRRRGPTYHSSGRLSLSGKLACFGFYDSTSRARNAQGYIIEVYIRAQSDEMSCSTEIQLKRQIFLLLLLVVKLTQEIALVAGLLSSIIRERRFQRRCRMIGVVQSGRQVGQTCQKETFQLCRSPLLLLICRVGHARVEAFWGRFSGGFKTFLPQMLSMLFYTITKSWI